MSHRKSDRCKNVLLLHSRIAKSVLLRVHEELAIDPDVMTFATPLLRLDERVKQALRTHPTDIAATVALGRPVHLELDETVEPPMVIINIAPAIEL